MVDPHKKVKSASAVDIDDEKFEAKIFTGALSVEDFNTNVLMGVGFTYFAMDRVYADFNYASSDTQRGNNEGNSDFNPDRTFSYASISGGYKLFDGRSFLGKVRKYNSDVNVFGGLESVSFAGNTDIGLVIGVNHKTVLTDYLTLNIDFKNHFVNRDFLDEEKLTSNTEFSIGLGTIF